MLPLRLINLRDGGEREKRRLWTQACFYFNSAEEKGEGLAQDGRNLAWQADCQILKTFSSTEAKWHLPCPDKTTGAKTGLPLKQAVVEVPETDPISWVQHSRPLHRKPNLLHGPTPTHLRKHQSSAGLRGQSRAVLLMWLARRMPNFVSISHFSATS